MPKASWSCPSAKQHLAPVCRFDRELLFPLPNQVGREGILDIHTRAWTAPPAPALRAELAAMTVGYCGADLKAGICEFADSMWKRLPSCGACSCICAAWGTRMHHWLRCALVTRQSGPRQPDMHSSHSHTCLQALCTEAALAALRRRYPQIYASEQRLLVDAAQVRGRLCLLLSG